jgi:hypothetical protein
MVGSPQQTQQDRTNSNQKHNNTKKRADGQASKRVSSQGSWRASRQMAGRASKRASRQMAGRASKRASRQTNGRAGKEAGGQASKRAGEQAVSPTSKRAGNRLARGNEGEQPSKRTDQQAAGGHRLASRKRTGTQAREQKNKFSSFTKDPYHR